MSDQGCREIEEALEEFALSFPEAWLDRPWGVDRVVKVRRKIFAFLSESTDACTALGVKLPESAEAMLLEPWATPSSHGLGRSGWVTMRFRDPEDVPLDLLLDLIVESYCAVAPKTLSARALAEMEAERSG